MKPSNPMNGDQRESAWGYFHWKNIAAPVTQKAWKSSKFVG